MSKIDELGSTFGKLTVIAQEESTPVGQSRWLCRCECGNELIARAARLRSGYTKQCRVCAAIERASKERELGIKRLNPFSNEARIKAWHKKMERDMENYALEDYYRYN